LAANLVIDADFGKNLDPIGVILRRIQKIALGEKSKIM
jgi:hypothetical protein